MGGPVAAGRNVLVTTVFNRFVELIAVSAATGKVVWATGDSPSYITSGVTLEPATANGVAIALRPTLDYAQTGLVQPEGLNVETGRPRWIGAVMAVFDVPRVCEHGRAFCLTGIRAHTTSGTFSFDARTGRLLAFQPGTYRWMGGNVYQGTLENLVGLGRSGRLEWERSLKAVFGSGFSPDWGWTFNNYGSFDVGYVGYAKGHKFPLAPLRTVGLSAASGATRWTDPGAFECGGPIVIGGPYLCRFPKGSGGFPIRKPVPAVVEGINPMTGTVRWSRRLRDVNALVVGSAPLVGSDEVVVGIGSDPHAVLNLRTGAVRRMPTSTTAWCLPKLRLVPVHPAGKYGPRRIAGQTAAACHIDGTPSSTLPRTPWFGGTLTDGYFVWARPGGGLEAARTAR